MDEVRQLGASEVALHLISKLENVEKEEHAAICTKFLDQYPEMLLLQNVGHPLLEKIRSGEQIKAFLEKLKEKINVRNEKIAEHASNKFQGRSIMTLSRSSTVLSAFRQLSDQLREVIVLESRPALEGRNMAKDIADMGVRVKIIADSAVGSFMDEVDLAVTGADAILSDGKVVNKIGTYPLALLCEKSEKPFFVLSSLFKADVHNIGVTFQERPSKEIWEAPPSNVTPVNIYFERLPPSLISGILCEKGEVPPENFVTKARKYVEF